MRKPSGIKDNGAINASWTKLKAKMEAHKDIHAQDWGPEQVIGYISQRYQEHMGVEYPLSYSGPPSKCQEMFIINRIMQKIGTKKGSILKDYVDYVFDKIVVPKKMSLNSMGLFITDKICADYRSDFRKRSKISKTTELPDPLKNIAIGLELNVTTYGDLEFIKIAIDNDPDNEDYNVYHTMFCEFKNNGFDDSILGSLENK